MTNLQISIDMHAFVMYYYIMNDVLLIYTGKSLCVDSLGIVPLIEKAQLFILRLACAYTQSTTMPESKAF